jgi:GWxTD domain-containing protein
MIKKIISLLLLTASFVFAAEQISWKDLQKNIDSWPKGPVSLIMTGDEKDVWKKLKTPEEKMEFIKIFWARRDPILRTRENEFKEEFYSRVDYANQTFVEGSTPGWQTARGQVYIAFGKPSRIDPQTYPGSAKPAQLWVYDQKLPQSIPANEAMLFVYRDFKYVLNPPNPQPGDTIGQQQREIDSNFRYQDIPSAVQRAFADIAKSEVIDPDKNYKNLLASVSSTEKFGVSEIQFEIKVAPSHPPKVSVTIPPENVPYYDDGQKVFSELFYKQELKKGDKLVASNEHVVSYSWDQKTFADLKSVDQDLPALDAPEGTYELSVTVGDKISGVSETRKVEVTY